MLLVALVVLVPAGAIHHMLQMLVVEEVELRLVQPAMVAFARTVLLVAVLVLAL
jgi:hypothetical protein